MDNTSTVLDGMVSTLNSGTLSKQPTDLYTDLYTDMEDDNDNRYTHDADVIPEEDLDATEEVSIDEKVKKDKPVFFNYHESSETYYAEIDEPEHLREHDDNSSLCITHFMNVYAPPGSARFNETRLVRVPRRFDIGNKWHPMFSDLLPGHEPGAMVNHTDGTRFVARGITRDGQVYGFSSVSPLSQYLDERQYGEIVTRINAYLMQTYSAFGLYNILNFILELLTLGLWSYVTKYVNRGLHTDPMKELDNYITELNQSPLFTKNSIKLINPRETGFLSLDFEIPKPMK
ncbi:hypothetical protein RNJ44_00200 [Nakaseomyces bracarensis]|uniref:Ras modification protein ERF4 n=1 Tax=Nakaseomyces bracarensis TaxID=273131 RepID=A0ABR4NT70_9SACH